MVVFQDCSRVTSYAEEFEETRFAPLLPACRLLAANILISFLKEAFRRSVILFQSDFCFMRKGLRFPLRSFEFGRCGKSNKRIRSSSEICPCAPCAGHSTKHQS